REHAEARARRRGHPAAVARLLHAAAKRRRPRGFCRRARARPSRRAPGPGAALGRRRVASDDDGMSGEKREGVARRAASLPLFPLRTVLFPGGLLPLKVFEHRYIEMTKTCLREERPFGVCLILEGDEVAQPDAQAPKIASVGTLARITVVDMPQLGILHVATVGEGRFEVHRYAPDAHGLVVGDVTPIPDEPRMPLAESQARLSKLLALIATRLGPDSFPS